MKLKLVIPSSLKEITLQQYKRFLLLDHQNEKDYMVKVLQIFASGDIDNLDKFPISKLEPPLKKLLKVLQNSDVKTYYKVKVKGVEYGLNPKLSDITVGEMADIEEYLKDGQYNNIEKVLAVLYRPITQQKGKFYQTESYNGLQGRDELFLKHFPVVAFLGATLFFSIIESQFMTALAYYSAKTKKNRSSKQVAK